MPFGIYDWLHQIRDPLCKEQLQTSFSKLASLGDAISTLIKVQMALSDPIITTGVHRSVIATLVEHIIGENMQLV